MTDPIEVTDEDRQAAAAYWAGWSYNVPEVDGKIHPLVYAFASVRLAAEARGAERERARVDAKAIAHDVVQSVCETDPADPENPNTVLVAMQDLYDIVQAEIEAALSRHADQGEGQNG